MATQTWFTWMMYVLSSSLASVAAAVAVRVVTDRTPPGLLRLLLCAPAALIFTAAPFIFEVQSMSRASAAAMLLWLANFKLVALCLGRGPLTQRGLTLGQFTALLLWPIIPQLDPDGRVSLITDPRARKSAAWQRLFWRAPENLGVFLLACYTLTHPMVPIFPKTYSAAFGVCCYCGLWANAAAALVIWAHGLQVAPSWDRPWLQTSLGDFWARRWNLPTSSSLKHLVYEPIVEGRWVVNRRARTATTNNASKAASAVGPAADGVADAAADGAAEQAPENTAASKAASAVIAPPPSGPWGQDEPSRPSDVDTTIRKRVVKDVSIENNMDIADVIKSVAGGHQGSIDQVSHGSVGAASGREGRRGGGGASRRGGGSPLVRLVGLMATFLVSGLMHELLLWICTGNKSHLGKQARFFIIQGPLVVAEQSMVRALTRAGIHLPTWLCMPVASLTLQVPAMYWFWGAYFDAVARRGNPLAAPLSLTGVQQPLLMA